MALLTRSAALLPARVARARQAPLVPAGRLRHHRGGHRVAGLGAPEPALLRHDGADRARGGLRQVAAPPDAGRPSTSGMGQAMVVVSTLAAVVACALVLLPIVSRAEQPAEPAVRDLRGRCSSPCRCRISTRSAGTAFSTCACACGATCSTRWCRSRGLVAALRGADVAGVDAVAIGPAAARHPDDRPVARVDGARRHVGRRATRARRAC